ncbi:hypothetical protein [Nocardioides bigeumensis]|uniref:Integral membrane protein n=1 Tax=Nocardioides bigeumensis TaxID=433657 RepID=A0ABP5K4U8_9ACTN
MHGSAVASSWQTDLCDGGSHSDLPALKGLIALRLLACLAALAGGVVLAVARLLDGTLEALYWVGLALVAVALAGAGAGLVKSGAGWLRIVVGAAFPAMVLSVYSAVRPADPDLVDLASGVVAVVLGVVFLVRPLRSSGRERYHGSHAG